MSSCVHACHGDTTLLLAPCRKALASLRPSDPSAQACSGVGPAGPRTSPGPGFLGPTLTTTQIIWCKQVTGRGVGRQAVTPGVGVGGPHSQGSGGQQGGWAVVTANTNTRRRSHCVEIGSNLSEQGQRPEVGGGFNGRKLESGACGLLTPAWRGGVLAAVRGHLPPHIQKASAPFI